MKKIYYPLFLTCVFASVVFGQTQSSKWSVSGKDIAFSANQTTQPVIKDDGLPTSFKSKNSVHDNKGRTLFYVGDWKIYDKFGSLIAELEPRPTTTGNHSQDFNAEYSIVPCIEENTGCIKNYYVFYSSYSNILDVGVADMQLFAKLITIDNITGNIQAKDVKDNSGNRRILATSTPFNFQGTNQFSHGFGGLAVSQLINNKRYLYWISGKVQKITLNNLNNGDDGISAPSEIFSLTQNPNFEFATLEADLSHYGDRLIWGTAKNETNVQKYFMIGLNPTTGNWDLSINEIFTLPTSESNQSTLRGVEFAPDGLSFYVTTGGTQGNHGIYRRSLTSSSSSFQFIPNSNIYGRSQLELARNGLIYAVSSSGNAIDGINLTTNTFSLSARINITIGLAQGGYYTLPDQIDGEIYDNTPLDFYDIRNYSMPEITINAQVDYTQNSNPFNTSGNPIKIAGTLSFVGTTKPEGDESKYLLTRMTFSMAKDAKIVIGDGMSLTIAGCTFQSADCSDMWSGFEVIGTGQLFIKRDTENSPVKPTEIYDAKVGIETKGGGLSRIRIRDAIFNRNKTHIKLNSYRFYNIDGGDISGCKFLHTQPLRIFENGQQFPTLLQYGKISIELTGNIMHNTPLMVENNLFEGGQYGVYSTGIPFKVRNLNTFKNFSSNLSKCIYVDMIGRNETVEVDSAIFTDVHQALYAQGKSNITFSDNTVNGVEHHAIEIYRNNDRSIIFHDNKYYRFKSSCILLNNNAGTSGTFNKTTVEIFNEIFDNKTHNFMSILPSYLRYKPTAITVMEPGGSLSQNYKKLRINNNNMTDIAYGVRAYNLFGVQQMNKPYSYDYPNRLDFSDIDNNTIKVYANYSSLPDTTNYNSGMLLANSRGLVSAVNNIISNQSSQWRSSGIYCNNTRQTLFYKNVITAGRGIRGDYAGTGNDFKCNTFIRGINGISLQDYNLRLAGQTHGVNFIESRDNNYSKTAKENIELYLHRVAPTPVNISNYINYNQWFMNGNPSTLIEPTPACSPFLNCIKRTGAPDMCNVLTSDGGGGTKIQYNTPTTHPYNPNDMLNNWQLHYEYERQQKEAGLVYNTLIRNIIDIEEMVTNGEDATALSIVNGMQSNFAYEHNYIELYKRLIPARLERNGVLDSPEVAYFKSIASQDPYTAGPSIFLARAILWQQEGLHYIDMDDRNSGNISVQLNGEECIGQIPEDFSIQLKNEEGYIYSYDEVPLSVDDEGYVFIPNTVVASLPQDLNYTFVLDDGNYPSPEFQSIADWMDEDNNTIYLCNNSLLGKATKEELPISQSTQPTKINMSSLGISIFPNPAKDVVNIMPANKQEFSVAVYDIMGKKVYAQTHSQNAVLHSDYYNPGVYLVKIYDEKGNILATQRLIIKP